MKATLRIFSLLLLTIVSASPIHAQLRYGFNLGGSLPTAAISHADNASIINRTGFRGGLTLEYQHPHCGAAFDISLLYDRRNTRMMSDISPDRPICYGRNFLDIPLHAKYKFWLPSTSKLVAPMIVTGPSLAISLDGKHHGAGLITQKRIHPSWDFGVGFDAANILQLTLGYRLALTNSISESPMLPDARLRSSGAYLSVLILFDF